MAKMLKLSSIKPPALYIRGEKGPDMGHVADLQDVIKSNPDKNYPFHDAVVVRKLTKPEKIKTTMANKAGTVEYELGRGIHRCLALVAEKYTEVSAEIIEAGDAEFFALQYDDGEQGTIKKHDLQERNFYIKTLRDNFGWKLEQIAQRMKLTEASISRILADKQATPGKKKKKPRRKKTETAASETTKTFVIPEFFALLGELVAAYTQNKDAVLGYMKPGTVDPAIIAGAENMIAEMLGNR